MFFAKTDSLYFADDPNFDRFLIETDVRADISRTVGLGAKLEREVEVVDGESAAFGFCAGSAIVQPAYQSRVQVSSSALAETEVSPSLRRRT